jgi:hypothetical protein
LQSRIAWQRQERHAHEIDPVLCRLHANKANERDDVDLGYALGLRALGLRQSFQEARNRLVIINGSAANQMPELPIAPVQGGQLLPPRMRGVPLGGWGVVLRSQERTRHLGPRCRDRTASVLRSPSPMSRRRPGESPSVEVVFGSGGGVIERKFAFAGLLRRSARSLLRLKQHGLHSRNSFHLFTCSNRPEAVMHSRCGATGTKRTISVGCIAVNCSPLQELSDTLSR